MDINTFFEKFYANSDFLVALILLFCSGLACRFTLQVFGQTWVKTKAHTATIFFLPIITYVITKVISGNIALSLGMVGALSIVRFRHPVRSPLELSVYFGSITLGIAASVNIKWVILLVISIAFIVIALTIIDLFFKRYLGRSMFISSFSEGNSLSTLIVGSSSIIDVCEKNEMLQSRHKSNDGVTYYFAADDFQKLIDLEKNDEVQNKSNTTELKR
tara:strand:- start:310 stop:960 length:651 start_codon:yes stop_codon:yes gene_type:complete